MSETNLLTVWPNKEVPAWDWIRSSQNGTDSEEIRLILWDEIWPSLCSAKRHGNSNIAALFLDRLFEGAMFDDEGAWLVKKTESFNWPMLEETRRRSESSLLH